MASDARSDSDFYGGRPAQTTAGNQSASATRRQRNESTTSSFFNPPNTGNDMLATAGYNRDSYLDTGRSVPLQPGKDEEEGGWDVYADFNNAGPRYATIGTQEKGYQQIGTASGRPVNIPAEPLLTDAEPQVEMVTVPALGAEWKQEELADMTKSYKRKVRNDERMQKWKAWNRDQYGLCGGWGTRKTLAWLIFGICVVVGLLLAFLIPRVPNVTFSGVDPFTPGEGNATFLRNPANFSFNANLGLTIDTNANFIPLAFNSLDAAVYAADTGRKVGNGTLTGVTLPAKQYVPLTFPVVFAYETQNDTDPTWLQFYNACKNRAIYPDGIRPGLGLRVLVGMNIAGLVSSATVTAAISSLECPYELSLSAA